MKQPCVNTSFPSADSTFPLNNILHVKANLKRVLKYTEHFGPSHDIKINFKMMSRTDNLVLALGR